MLSQVRIRRHFALSRLILLAMSLFHSFTRLGPIGLQRRPEKKDPIFIFYTVNTASLEDLHVRANDLDRLARRDDPGPRAGVAAREAPRG